MVPAKMQEHLTQMLETLFYQTNRAPENAELRGRLETLIYLHKLYLREQQITAAPHTGTLIEIARMMETDFLELHVDRATQYTPDQTVRVYDATRGRYIGVLTFKKLCHKGHFTLDHYTPSE